jgi:exodeoxyribonuclease III
VKVATWNVNSIRARLERLRAFLVRHAPDVVALQETKVVDADFPVGELSELGYHCLFHGQKSYNGVALLSRAPMANPQLGFCDGNSDSEARVLSASIEGVRFASVYVPNGRSVGSDAYLFKLEWLARLRNFLEQCGDPSQPLAVLGDFNVAPRDLDVHDPLAWKGQIMCSDAERAALERVAAWGLYDAFRELNPDAVAFSWWDYRQLGFQKNRGLRIDHALLTRPLLERCQAARIDREERKGKLPSDHAPVLIELG